MSGINPTSENAAYLASAAGYNVELPASPTSENAQYLAEVVARLEALSHIGRYLAIWNCTTGLPTTNPQTMPYSYATGDYFVVGTIAAEGGTNYKPNGTTYNGTASTTEESSNIAVGDMYRFDGTTWERLKFSDVLNNYVRKEEGKGLSSNDYTTAEKTKLANITDETWTFTLSDNTTVTKVVKVGS